MLLWRRVSARLHEWSTSGDFLPKLRRRDARRSEVSLCVSFEWRFVERGGELKKKEKKKKKLGAFSEILSKWGLGVAARWCGVSISSNAEL